MAVPSGENISDMINFNYNYLVVQTIMKMRDAKAKRDWWEYWVSFEFAMQLVLSYLEPVVSKEIQLDYSDMDKRIQAIRLNALMHESARQTNIDQMRTDFADRHRYYVLKALNKIGIVKVAEDGVVDFDSTELQTLAAVIRSDRKDDNTEKLAGIQTVPRPDGMTLVYDQRVGKVLPMGSDQYKAYVQDKINQKIESEKNASASATDGSVPPTQPSDVKPSESPSQLSVNDNSHGEPIETAAEAFVETEPVNNTSEALEQEEADKPNPSEYRLRINYPKNEETGDKNAV